MNPSRDLPLTSHIGGETGHQARDCPTRNNPLCYNCKQTGHLSRDCPEPRNTATPGASGETDRVCYRCYQPGHMAKDCPTEGAAAGQECYKCGRLGHIARNCTSGAGGMGGGMRGGYGGGGGGYGGGYGGGFSQGAKQCYSCGGFGHMSRDCTQGQKCYNCQSIFPETLTLLLTFVHQAANMVISPRTVALPAPIAFATSANNPVTSRLSAPIDSPHCNPLSTIHSSRHTIDRAPNPDLAARLVGLGPCLTMQMELALV